jgi:uncharacterized protein with HEPN domain
MRSDRERLIDIFEAIEKIERYVDQGKSAFDSEELIQVWMIHHLQTIGEAAAKVDRHLRNRYPTIPWAQIIAMRNLLIHDYFSVDPDEVWSAAVRDVPTLKKEILTILDDTDSENPPR